MQLAVRKNIACEPLVRGESRKRDSFLIKEECKMEKNRMEIVGMERNSEWKIEERGKTDGTYRK